MIGWQESKQWSDGFLPEIKAILGVHLIGEAPQKEDQEHNTDLIVLTMAPVRVACRVRSAGYSQYRNEFTLRTHRPSGMKTEMRKILEGWGDYFFYGHQGEDGLTLGAWLLGDLKPFRAWVWESICKGRGVPGTAKSNLDGSSEFRVFRVADIPSDFMVAHHNIPALEVCPWSV